MLLRSITQHIKDQNWFAVTLDFVIVVVGVFIGIQVSNWNNARVEQSQEREYLLRLHEEFSESITNQTRDLNFLAVQLSDQNTILTSLDACEVANADALAFQRGLNTLGFINPPRFSRRAVDEMMSSGNTDIIKNQSIKSELVDIVGQVEWRASVHDMIMRSIENRGSIIKDKIRYNLSTTYPDPFIGEFVGVSYNIQELCADSRIASAISAISFDTKDRQNAYKPIMQRYKDLLPLLETELLTRWGQSATGENTQ